VGVAGHSEAAIGHRCGALVDAASAFVAGPAHVIVAEPSLGHAALRVVVLAEVDLNRVDTVRHRDLPVDGLRGGGGTAGARAVEVVDAEAVVAADAATAAGVVDVVITVAVPAVLRPWSRPAAKPVPSSRMASAEAATGRAEPK
jgi:hypothetical protein